MSSDGAASLQELLNNGWDYHDEESERLARELEAAADKQVTSNDLAPLLHLTTHTIGEHLGDWTRAFSLGKRVLDGQTPTFETAKAWGRLYVAAVLAGDSIGAAETEISYLKAAGDDFGAALLDMRFMLAVALVGAKRVSEAARLYRGALDLVGQMRQSALLDRTIAVASNNLGWELYEKLSRTAHEDALMQLCAEMSLKFWLKCGDWINEERALYLKALVSNATGNPQSALEDANKALAVINSHGERPLDAARLHLSRARSLAAMGDTNGRLRAIGDADVAASKLVAPNLKAQFDAERSKIVATLL
jgi:tetratricopeptide (TPR) repeat protein